MSLYKPEGSKNYYIEIQHITPKGTKKRIRKSTGYEDERKAWIEHEKFVKSLEDGSYDKQLTSISFEELSISYLDEGLPLLKEKTQNSYMTYILRFHEMISDRKVININREDIQDFVNWIRARGLSASSIRYHLAAISAVFSYGVRTGLAEDNPVRKFDKSYIGKVKERIRFLSKNEYELLLKSCSHEFLIKAIILAVETGFRKEELFSLKWEKHQVDFEKKEITLWDTKNKEHRTIPMSPVAYEVLKNLYDNKTCEYVFSYNGKGRVKDFKKSFSTAKKKANIEDFHWHDLRHTFATWILKGWFSWQKYPMDLYRLQKWLGHKDIKTTQRYAHLETKDLHNIVQWV